MLIFIISSVSVELSVTAILKIALVIVPWFLLGYASAKYLLRRDWIGAIEKKVSASLLSLFGFFLVFPFFILLSIVLLSLVVSPILSVIRLEGLLFFFIIGMWLGVNTNIVVRFLVPKLKE